MNQERTARSQSNSSHSASRLAKLVRISSLGLALVLMFGSLTACGSLKIRIGAKNIEESASAPAPQPSQTEEPGTATESPTGEGGETTGSDAKGKQIAGEAINAYKEFETLEIKLLSRNRTIGEPSWLKKYTTGRFYTVFRKEIKESNERTFRYETKTIDLLKTHARARVPKDNRTLALLQVCTDLTKANLVDKKTGKKLRKASFMYRELEMIRIAGSFKIRDGKTRVVKECPFK